MRTGRLTGLILAAACAVGTSAGCESAPKEKTAQERQDEALKDPFRYKPNWDDTSPTSGDSNKLDKQGLKRDLGHVLMP